MFGLFSSIIKDKATSFKFKKVITYVEKDTNTTISKLNLIDRDGDVIATYIGKARLNPGDTFNERVGRRIAELRAAQLAHKDIAKIYKNKSKTAQAEVDYFKAIYLKSAQKLANIEESIKTIESEVE